MPYSKKVQDREAAVAEAIATTFANEVRVAVPAIFGDALEVEITEQGGTTYVNLPRFRQEQYLSILPRVLDDLMPECNDSFYVSLGKVAAFSWFIGQGDLSADNVAVSANGECYAFDFDCAFERVQSPAAYANKREPQFGKSELDGCSTAADIVDKALASIKSSAGRLGLDIPQLEPNTNQLSKIREGCHEVFQELASLDVNFFAEVIGKYANTNEKAAYMRYLSEKLNIMGSIIHSARLENQDKRASQQEALETLSTSYKNDVSYLINDIKRNQELIKNERDGQTKSALISHITIMKDEVKRIEHVINCIDRITQAVDMRREEPVEKIARETFHGNPGLSKSRVKEILDTIQKSAKPRAAAEEASASAATPTLKSGSADATNEARQRMQEIKKDNQSGPEQDHNTGLKTGL